MTLPLKLGPLTAGGFALHRSGVHWLRGDGDHCRAGEVVGYCNISLSPIGGWPGRIPFAEERELQVGLAPRVAGRLRIGAAASLGGHLDQFGVHSWDPDAVVAELEPDEGATAADGDPDVLRVLVLAGRRVTGLADVLTGLLPGWHSRARGWWGDAASAPTLLSIGICDAVGPVRGEQSAFTELFETSAGAGHVVFVPNLPIAPCATCLFEQLERTPAARKAISNDLVAALTSGSAKATPEDWFFAGALLATLEESPITDTYDLLTPSGLAKSGPASAVLISATAEGVTTLVHKKLGYCLHLLPVYRDAAGPAVKAWLSSAFEPLKRTIDDMKADYTRFVGAVAAKTDARVLILNKMSTSGREDVATYAPFDLPLSDTLANVASKEMNLMLDDLAAAHNVTVIDVDALAAELGGSQHVPDGIHQSGVLQAEIRSEIVQALA